MRTDGFHNPYSFIKQRRNSSSIPCPSLLYISKKSNISLHIIDYCKNYQLL